MSFQANRLPNPLTVVNPAEAVSSIIRALLTRSGESMLSWTISSLLDAGQKKHADFVGGSKPTDLIESIHSCL